MPKPIRTRKRTWDIPGAWYYITCVVKRRQAIFRDPDNMALLRETLHVVQNLYPFRMLGYAFMPDHIHLLIALGQYTHITDLMHSLERNYTINYKTLHHITRRISLWQRSYWEHVVWDQDDVTECLRYIHDNPWHHGLVENIRDYPHTSYHAYLAKDERWRQKGGEVGRRGEPSRWGRYEPDDGAWPHRPMGE